MQCAIDKQQNHDSQVHRVRQDSVLRLEDHPKMAIMKLPPHGSCRHSTHPKFLCSAHGQTSQPSIYLRPAIFQLGNGAFETRPTLPLRIKSAGGCVTGLGAWPGRTWGNLGTGQRPRPPFAKQEKNKTQKREKKKRKIVLSHHVSVNNGGAVG